MAKKKEISRQDSFSATCSSVVSGVISCCLLILVTVFPLIYDNSYFNILETKYICFYVSILAMLAVLLLLALVMLLIDWKEFQGEHTRELFAALKPENWKKTFCAADAAVLVFWLACVVSTIQSEYLYEAFWGNEGRYSGLFLITLYVAAYFVISRFWKLRGWVIQAFLATSLIVCCIGITDYFQMDILDFRGAIKPEQSTIFTSTLGNINTYTAYVALMMGVAAAMFATVKGWVKTIWYYVCMVVAFFAIIMGCSDNAYLAIGALFAFLPFLVFRKKSGVIRYLIMLATFATVIQCIDYINQVFADMVIGLDSLFRILVNFRGLLFAVIALWGLVAVAYVVFYRGSHPEEDELDTRLVRIWFGVVIAGAAAVCFMLVDANGFGNGARYGSLGNYLVFNDSWGTNRGYIWRKSIEIYRDFPMMHKLFGYGPDTFGIVTVENFRGEMLSATGQVFDSAHNEYLQFLITIGPIGLAAYLVFLGGNCLRMMKSWMARTGVESGYLPGCLFAVLCYGVQALVNLNLPIATPLMWILLSAGIALVRRDSRQK